jgi:hypothetical protein
MLARLRLYSCSLCSVSSLVARNSVASKVGASGIAGNDRLVQVPHDDRRQLQTNAFLLPSQDDCGAGGKAHLVCESCSRLAPLLMKSTSFHPPKSACRC